jgi:hypothetical protein
MEKILSYKDVEFIIFNNQQLQEKLPRFKNLFQSYSITRNHPTFKHFSARIVFEFMNMIEPSEVQVVSDFLDEQVRFDKFSFNLTSNITSNVDELEFSLGATKGFIEMVAYRNKDEVKITCWR